LAEVLAVFKVGCNSSVICLINEMLIWVKMIKN